jgi:large subunit ribosomal protein L23
MFNPYNIITNPLRTEKGAINQEKFNKYVFKVNTKATKHEIKKAVEEIYKVKVDKVNTTNVFGKWRRVRMIEGRRSDWKKAMVTLKKGEVIEMK